MRLVACQCVLGRLVTELLTCYGFMWERLAFTASLGVSLCALKHEYLRRCWNFFYPLLLSDFPSLRFLSCVRLNYTDQEKWN